MKKTILIISVILFIAAVIMGAAIASHFYLEPSQKEETITLFTEPTTENNDTIAPEDVVWNGDEFEALDNDGLVNILLIGQDKREGEERQRSDAMILCSFNPETNEVALISFLRDLYVRIPGYEDNRLNAAYAYGGFDLLKETLNLNFGISVDGCLESDFEGFKKIIDTIGGVEIELTAQEAEIIGNGATEGTCLLNGEQALTYARIRKIDSDFQRTERQRSILNAVFEKAKSYTLAELAVFFSDVLPLMSTDMTDEQIMSLALTLASSFSQTEINSYTVPAEGTYKNEIIRSMAVLVPDLYQIKKLIFEEYLPL